MTKHISLLCKPALHPVAELFVGGHIRMDEVVLPLNPGDAHQNIKAFALPSVADFGHNVPAAPHAQSGLDSRVTGGQAASTAAIFTFVKRCTQFGRQCGAAYTAPDPVPGSPTCIAVLLDWTLGGRFSQNRTGVPS
jgi:hypothetical protein